MNIESWKGIITLSPKPLDVGRGLCVRGKYEAEGEYTSFVVEDVGKGDTERIEASASVKELSLP